MLKHRHTGPVLLELKHIVSGSYPPFVRPGNSGPVRDYVPVFSSHEAEPQDFEAKLLFLRENGYHTVTTEDIYSWNTGKGSLPSKPVMISFDDGRKSIWSVAAPLLKKYDCRACLFLTPGIVRNERELSPTLENVWAGEMDMATLTRHMREYVPAAVSWAELGQMVRDGIVDVQAHSMNHWKIAVASRVETFVTPAILRRYYFEFDIPYWEGVSWTVDNAGSILGFPLHPMAPFFQERNRYQEDMDLARLCNRFVMENGGAVFFEEPCWKGELMALVRQYRKNKHRCMSFETAEEQEKRMTANASEARHTIESMLPGVRVRHFAYPWGAGGITAARALKQAGYVSAYWATLTGKSVNRAGDDPFRMVRCKHDFIWRLPGDGRKSAAAVFLEKLLRRASGRLDY